MQCPNCHKPYNEDVPFCPSCGHPLSNASYSSVSDSGKKKGSLQKRLTILVLLVCLIAVICGVGYYSYLRVIEGKCRKAVDQIFSIAHDLDLSRVDPSMLPADFPEELRNNPDVSSYLKDQLTRYLVENIGDETLANTITESLDMDAVCKDIVSDASYEITSSKADMKSCRVTVRTGNIDYAALSRSLYQEVINRLNDQEGLWKSISSFLSSVFFGSDKDKDEQDAGQILMQEIQDIYQEAKSHTERLEYTGVIEFGMKDGSWTITDMDPKLMYSYYGISNLIQSEAAR